MNKNPFISVFLWLFVSCSALALFSVGGHYAAGALFSSEDTYEPGTMIAGIDVSGQTEADASELLENRVSSWQAKQAFDYVLLEEKIRLPVDAVQFDISQALLDAKEQKAVELEAIIDEQRIREELMKIERYDVTSKVDTNELSQHVAEATRSLGTGKQTYNLNDFFKEEKKLATKSVAEVSLAVGEVTYLEEWVAALNGYVIDPQQLFALQDVLKEQGSPVFTSSGLDVLATGFYQLFMQTNFDLLERHTSLTLPENVTVGFAAASSPNFMDLKVVNSNYHTYEVVASYQNGQMNLSLHGHSFLHSYSLEVENVQQIQPRTIVHYSSRRMMGDKQVMKTGMIGYAADVYRVERDEHGVVVQKEKIASDFYPAQHRIEEWSLQQREPYEGAEDYSSGNTFPNVTTPPSGQDQNSETEENVEQTKEQTDKTKEANGDSSRDPSYGPVKGEE